MQLSRNSGAVIELCSGDVEARGQMPVVVLVDNLQNLASLGDTFAPLLDVPAQVLPYIIGSMRQPNSNATDLQLHHNFRWVAVASTRWSWSGCFRWVLNATHMEPVRGLLGRFFRRKQLDVELQTGSKLPAELVTVLDWVPKCWTHLNKVRNELLARVAQVRADLFSFSSRSTRPTWPWGQACFCSARSASTNLAIGFWISGTPNSCPICSAVPRRASRWGRRVRLSTKHGARRGRCTADGRPGRTPPNSCCKAGPGRTRAAWKIGSLNFLWTTSAWRKTTSSQPNLWRSRLEGILWWGFCCANPTLVFVIFTCPYRRCWCDSRNKPNSNGDTNWRLCHTSLSPWRPHRKHTKW